MTVDDPVVEDIVATTTHSEAAPAHLREEEAAALVATPSHTEVEGSTQSRPDSMETI